MSIITEALRKAEQKRDGKIDTPIALPGKVEGPYRRRSSKSQLIILFSYVSVVVIAVFFVSLIGLASRRSSSQPTARPQETSQVEKKVIAEETDRPAPAAAEEPPVAVTAPEQKAVPAQNNNFVIKGIMYAPEHPLAIINDITVSEGDTIEGAVVAKISEDSILLNCQGETVRLKLH